MDYTLLASNRASCRIQRLAIISQVAIESRSGLRHIGHTNRDSSFNKSQRSTGLGVPVGDSERNFSRHDFCLYLQYQKTTHLAYSSVFLTKLVEDKLFTCILTPFWPRGFGDEGLPRTFPFPRPQKADADA